MNNADVQELQQDLEAEKSKAVQASKKASSRINDLKEDIQELSIKKKKADARVKEVDKTMKALTQIDGQIQKGRNIVNTNFKDQ